MLMGSINYCGDLISYNDENIDYFTNQTNKDKNIMQFIEIESTPCLNADQFQFKVLCAGKLILLTRFYFWYFLVFWLWLYFKYINIIVLNIKLRFNPSLFFSIITKGLAKFTILKLIALLVFTFQ